MAVSQILLLVFNILGGAAVIGSYVQGFVSHPGNVDILWGNITGPVRSVYFASMILSAVGYFAFMYFLLFRLSPSEVKVAGTFNYDIFFVILSVVLLFSALWMPFTYSYVDIPNTGTWIAIRTVLFLVGIASCALIWALLSLNAKQPTISYWLAVAGSSYFAFHTLILDAFLWPVLYK